MGKHNQCLGKKGEDYVADALKKKGMKILGRNVRTRYGELDVIAKSDGAIIFYEVKSRQSLEYGSGDEAVSGLKLVHLKRSVQKYLCDNPTELEVRLVAATVDFSSNSKPDIKFLRVV